MKDEWIEWLQDKQRNFFYGVTIVIALFFIAFQLFGKFHKPAPSNYATANLALEKWLFQGNDFENVEKALASNPELESKFGAIIADKLIVQNHGDKAQPFAESVFERVLKQAPEHTAFAEGSLLISQGKISEALSSSLALNDRLDKSSLLYGFNLFRIASLYRALDNQSQEQASLEELDRYMATNPQANAILTECFSVGDITLKDYVSQRKNKAIASK